MTFNARAAIDGMVRALPPVDAPFPNEDQEAWLATTRRVLDLVYGTKGRPGVKEGVMTKYGTSFVETEAILAAQEGDVEEVNRLIDRMLPEERKRLADAAYELWCCIERRE